MNKQVKVIFGKNHLIFGGAMQKIIGLYRLHAARSVRLRRSGANVRFVVFVLFKHGAQFPHILFYFSPKSPEKTFKTVIQSLSTPPPGLLISRFRFILLLFFQLILIFPFLYLCIYTIVFILVCVHIYSYHCFVLIFSAHGLAENQLLTDMSTAGF